MHRTLSAAGAFWLAAFTYFIWGFTFLASRIAQDYGTPFVLLFWRFALAFLVLNLYSMGLSSTLARTAVRQAFGAPRQEQYGELCFTDRAGKQLPLGTYYRFTR